MFDYQIPQWSMIKNPIHLDFKNHDLLLITVGDSWTYGDSLGKTKVRNGIDDTEYRLKHVYGSIIANELNASWLNIALPGGSNKLMLLWLSNFLNLHHDKYKKIKCIITLTESGRHEELQLINNNLALQQVVLEDILEKTYASIERLKQNFQRCDFLVAHNFTDALETTFQMCEMSWLEILLNRKIQNKTHIVVSDHIKQMNYEKRFDDVFDIMDKAAARVNLLDECEHCNKEDSRHPTEHGHMLWASYLLEKL